MANNFRRTKAQREAMTGRFNEVSEELQRINDFDSRVPRDVTEAKVAMETAPTSNPPRPRAKSIGYDSKNKTLYVIFRDNTWWEYRNVPVKHWVGIQNASSTGKYLRKSGLDQWPDMGPADLNNMSTESKTRMADNAEKSDKLQKFTSLDDYLFGKGEQAKPTGKPKNLDDYLFGSRD